jgi:hypothetical protein
MELRWLRADWSVTPEPVPYAKLGNPQSLNLYAYVDSDPSNYADPDGHSCYDRSADGCSPSKQAQEKTDAQKEQARLEAQQRRKQTARRIVTGVRGVIDTYIGIQKLGTGVAAGISTPVTGAAGPATAAYLTVSGGGQVYQGEAELHAAIVTGDVKGAEDTADKVASSTTLMGMAVIQGGGDVKTAAAAGAVEQLGTSALKREVFQDTVENVLAVYDLVTGGNDK